MVAADAAAAAGLGIILIDKAHQKGVQGKSKALLAWM
jgi:hypothetical protein